jgi:hypothetical protein
MYPSFQQPQNTGMGIAPPTDPTKGFESLKDLVRVLVINCNDKVRQFYVSKFVEPSDIKNDLIAFLEDFADLVLNTSEVLRYKKGQVVVKYNDMEKSIEEWCDLADEWIQMKQYENPLNFYDVFRDGVMIYKAYLKALTVGEIFDV